MTAPRPRATPSVLLLLLVLGALAVGAAASIVESATGTGVNGTGPVSEVYFGNDVIVVAILLLFGALTASLLVQRVHGGRSALPSQYVIGVLVTILILVGFAVLLQHVVGGSTSAVPTNATSNSTGTTPPTPKGPGNGTGGVPVVLHLPSWGLFAVLAGIAGIAVVVVFPRVRSYLADRREGRRQIAPEEEARAALGHAAERLAAGTDPRDVVRELYGHLLDRVEPLAGDLDPSTPDEIRSGPLRRLGIRADAADALTRLFEEARYSTHPMGPEAAERAARAIREAETDLGRRTEPE